MSTHSRVASRRCLALEPLEARLLLSADPIASALSVPTEVREWISRDGVVQVTAYDMTGSGTVDGDNIAVAFGANDTVSSIALRGTKAMNGLGLVVSGANSVGAITDARRGHPGEISVIASEAPISVLSLKTGVSGFTLSGQTLGGVTFGDLDGDSDLSDLTALYCKGAKVATFGGGVTGNLIFDGVNADGFSLGTLRIGAGGLNGELDLKGSGQSVTIVGDLNGHGPFPTDSDSNQVNIGGSLGSLTVKDGNIGGPWAIPMMDALNDGATIPGIPGLTQVNIGGSLGSLSVTGGNIFGAISAVNDIRSLSVSAGRAGFGGTLGGTVTAGGVIRTISTQGGDLTAVVTADHLGNVTVRDGDFTGQLASMALAGGPTPAFGIQSVDVTGGDLSGTIDSKVRIDRISVSGRKAVGGDITAGATISTDGRLGVLMVRGGIVGQAAAGQSVSISAESIGVAQIGGDVSAMQMSLSALPGLGRKAIGVMQVRGALDSSTIRSAGDIGVLTVQTMQDSLVYAGVSNSVIGLPDPTTDFAAQATIGVLRVQGVKGGAASFINSNVAGYNLGDIRLGMVNTANTSALFGVAAHDYKVLAYSDAFGPKLFTHSASVPDDGDFRVRLA